MAQIQIAVKAGESKKRCRHKIISENILHYWIESSGSSIIKIERTTSKNISVQLYEYIYFELEPRERCRHKFMGERKEAKASKGREIVGAA